jgi:hypothetical protein
MLENIKQGENIEHDDTIMDLRNACGSAQPKIQKMITEEEDHEKIGNLKNDGVSQYIGYLLLY